MHVPIALKNNLVGEPLHQSLAYWRKISPLAPHSSEAGVNTLVDASAAIFESIETLVRHPNSQELYSVLTQQLERLRQHYQRLEYPQDISLTAHYVLCATLDDIMRHHKQPLTHHSTVLLAEPAQFLPNFHRSHVEQDKFYSILEHIRRQPLKYIDLLELVYLCLRFGYKGQYSNTPYGLQQWWLLTEQTYQLIIEMRGQPSSTLSAPVLYGKKNFAPSPSSKKSQRFYVYTVGGLFALMLIASLVFKEAYDATDRALQASQDSTSFSRESSS